eukprot:5200042-Amphidinium_carterae.1
MREDDPSGTLAEGESRPDSPSGTHAEGGIPGRNENRRQNADPSGTPAEGEAVKAPPGLDHYIRPTAKGMARPEEYKPSRRWIGKQSPPIVAQLEE